MPCHFKSNPPPSPSTAQMGDDLGRDPSWVLTQREGDFEPPVTTPRIYHLKCELEALFSCFLTTMGHLATYVVPGISADRIDPTLQNKES